MTPRPKPAEDGARAASLDAEQTVREMRDLGRQLEDLAREAEDPAERSEYERRASLVANAIELLAPVYEARAKAWGDVPEVSHG